MTPCRLSFHSPPSSHRLPGLALTVMWSVMVVGLALTAVLPVGVMAVEDGPHSATVIWSNDERIGSSTGRVKETNVEPLYPSQLMAKVKTLVEGGVDVYLMINRDNAAVPLSPSDLETLVEDSGGKAYTVHPYSKFSAIQLGSESDEAHKQDDNKESEDDKDTRALEDALKQLEMLQEVWKVAERFKVVYAHPRTGVSVQISDPLKVEEGSGRLIVTDVTPTSLETSTAESSLSESELSAELRDNIRLIIFQLDGEKAESEEEAHKKFAAVLISIPVHQVNHAFEGLDGIHGLVGDIKGKGDSSTSSESKSEAENEVSAKSEERRSAKSEERRSAKSEERWSASTGQKEEVNDKKKKNSQAEFTFELNSDTPINARAMGDDGEEKRPAEKQPINGARAMQDDGEVAKELNMTEFSLTAILLLVTSTIVVLMGMCCLHGIDTPASFVDKPLVLNKEY